MAIRLNVPAKNLALHLNFTLSKAGINKWLHNLPISDAKSTSNQLYHAINSLNRSASKSKEKLLFIELTRPLLMDILQNFEKAYYNVTMPLPKSTFAALQVNRLILSGLADLYKIIVDENSTDKKVSTPCGEAIVEAIYFLGKYLRILYYVYKETESIIWKDLFQLYIFAEQHHILDKKITSRWRKFKTTVNEEFMCVLLFSVCDPYRLDHEQQNNLEQLIQSSPKINLENVTRDSFDDNLYTFVDFSLNLPPPHTTKHVHNLLRAFQIHDYLEKLNTKKTKYNYHELLVRPLLQWQKTQSGHKLRYTERLVADRQVKSILGLHDIHFFMNNYTQLMASQFPSPEDEEIEEGNNFEATLDERLKSTGNREIVMQSNVAPIWAGLQETPLSSMADVINESRTGCCLLWKNKTSSCLAMGKLIAVSKENNSELSSLLIGYIRWLRNVDDNYYVGVEWLSICFAAINIAPNYKGLILTGTPEYPYYSLLSDRQQFSVNDIIDINLQDELSTIKLTNRMTKTGKFSQFSYSLDIEEDEAQVDSQ